jgi:hypothetical protein
VVRGDQGLAGGREVQTLTEPGAGERIGTADLPFTRSTASRTERSTCTDHPVVLYAWIGCHPNRDTLTWVSGRDMITAVRAALPLAELAGTVSR